MVADCRRYLTAATLIAIAALSGCDEPTPPSAPDSITVSPASASLASIDGTARLIATVFDQHGEEMPDEPLAWKSPDPAVATVDARGTVTAKGNGTVAVEVSAGSAQATAAVTVRQEPARLEVVPEVVMMESLGDTARIVGTAWDANGHPVPEAEFTWSSIEPEVATVDSAGLVEAVANGVTSVTVETAGLAASVAVTVSQAAATVAVSPAADTVLLRDTTRLEAVVADANGHVIANPVLEWVARDASVAEVDDAGLVTGVGEGTTTVAAVSKGVEGTAEITVVNPDRAVLVAFYEATDGPNWTSNSNWLTDRPLDEWYGVVTDDDGRVVKVNLGNNSLAGELPPELGELSGLNYLSLEYNDLVGGIPPQLGDLQNLEHLHLDNTALTGGIPHQLGGLPSLVHIRLNRTPIGGEIPPELGDLSNLWMLELSDTELTGEIPPELGDLSNLEALFLDGNSLTGEIPPELGSLPSLTRLWLYDNELTGEIPPELGSLPSLIHLWLNDNELTGTIPPELGSLPSLTSLRLYDNELTGTIPPELGSLPSLTTLRLYDNELTGTIPPELGDLSDLEWLNLSSNSLTGEIPPELGDLSNLVDLHLDNNSLTGEVPLDVLDLSSLAAFYWDVNNGLCVPDTSEFDDWLDGLEDWSGPRCD